MTCVPAGLGLGALALALSSAGTERVVAADVPDLGYAKTLTWHLDGVPELAAMEPTIRGVLGAVHVTYAGIDGQPIEGFFPGPTYSYERSAARPPFFLYIRDTATDMPMLRYYYGAPAIRSTLEEFLRVQYPDGSISATVAPDFKVDKATVVSDEETSAIVCAMLVYDALPDPAWLKQSLRGQPLVERLNRAMGWVLGARRDPESRLIKRAHTTDWGDIKWEPNTDPSHMRPGDQWTASIYDQAIAYAALQGLARLNAAAGNDQERARWENEARDLRAFTNAALWLDDADHGYYRIHKHLAPDHVQHSFNEDDVIAIGNAAAVFYGLAEPEKVPRILAALERARVQAGAQKPGLTLQPPYVGWFQVQMDERMYQNGALWDWWAGRQISGESPWLGRNGAEQAYAGAAAVVGQAVVEGLFGVQIVGREVRLAPRLDDLNGGIRVYEPAADVYVAYEYQATERSETLKYGSNSPVALSVTLPVRWRGGTAARLDGKDWLPISYQRTGEVVIGTVIVPSGAHSVEFRQVSAGRAKF